MFTKIEKKTHKIFLTLVLLIFGCMIIVTNFAIMTEKEKENI